MNILYTFFNFNGFTGSELYYYELAREMVNLGHKVTIASNCGGEIRERAEIMGIKCIQFNEVQKFSEFDIIHASHKPVLHGLSLHKKTCPWVVTVHSEILDIEKVESPLIDHYIGIRPAICDNLPGDKSSLVYNPIDFSRFNKKDCQDKHDLIFVPGTINYLRANMIVDLASTYGDHYNIMVMGSNDFPDIKIKGVHYMHPEFDVESTIKQSFSVAGIIKGRTYIEASLCGKSYIDYKVNKEGMIQDIKILKPSEYLEFGEGKVHYSEFDSRNVAKKIEDLYNRL